MRNLIRFVEAWNEVGEPTRLARLAQARAFLALCMPDRGWLRVKDLVEDPTPDLEALELAARLFLRRGWPNRARKPLERALALQPDAPTLRRLEKQVERPPSEPDHGLEESDDPVVLLRVAETWLATGALIKGRRVLERIRREHPENARAEDLLWVLDGDFAFEGAPTLADLTERFAPDLSMLADLGDEAEHTESVTLQDVLPLGREREDHAPFPALFRHDDETGDTDGLDGAEVTRSTTLADLEALRRSVQAARRSAGVVSNEEDTQIRRVIRRGDDPVSLADAGPDLHDPHTVPGGDPSFDLQDFRREMGVEEPRRELPESDLDDPLEEEDDELIVLTRRAHEGDLPLQEPDPTSESRPHPDAARFLAEAERLRRLEEDRRPPPDPEVVPEVEAPARPARRRRTSPSTTPVWLVVLAGLLGILAFFLFVLVVVQVLAS